MSVLFCDTDCELWYTQAREMDLKVIGMPYTIDGEERMYDLGENTDFKGFYNRMKEGAAPITSGLNPETYREIFEPYFKSGEDILYIAFSSKMSNTFKYLDVALAELKAKYPDVKYRQFDTLNISMGAGLMVYMAAAKFKENGGDVDATYAYLESIVDNVAVLFVVDDLKFLARGGRLSTGKAALGNIMKLKPVLYVSKKGEIEILTKQSGSKKAMTFVLNEIRMRFKNIDDAPIVIVGADCDEAVAEAEQRIKALDLGVEVWTQPVGPVIGAHCGPGTYGIIFTATGR